ncbi:uncharacterized protein LOC135471080 [Liolophura sinensis]|uniref:uncharacterized protein LOC135471080 n=1 Tax=Liolophura sinensis TaxID=3198878 RepID=UPI0031582F59
MEIDVDRLLQEGIMKRQQPTDNVFRLHLMSTNNDMEVEKNVLYEDVCPKIQQICHHQGQVLQVIEHPPEDAFSHSTRKQDIDSSYHCTLVLIGEKRAPTTLPKVINAREFKVLMEIGENFLEHSPLMDSFQNLSASTQLDLKQDMKSTLTFLQKHYKKDLNSVPPSFILQPDHRSSLENQLSNGTEFKVCHIYVQ